MISNYMIELFTDAFAKVKYLSEKVEKKEKQ